MSISVLDGKRILMVDDEVDVLAVLEDEITSACQTCVVHRATTYEEGVRQLESEHYDLAILDIMGVRGFDLLELAVKKKLRVAMLTAHALNAEALKRAYDLGARAYLPKDKLGEIVPFLEDILTHDFETGWKRLSQKLGKYFNGVFGTDWEKKTGFDSPYWGLWG
jgi:DNA-binding response OmpR family regulator